MTLPSSLSRALVSAGSANAGTSLGSDHDVAARELRKLGAEEARWCVRTGPSVTIRERTRHFGGDSGSERICVMSLKLTLTAPALRQSRST